MCAQYYEHRVVGIVEGPNYGGKTTLMKQLKALVPSSTIIELHDFYHHQFMKDPGFGKQFTIDDVLRGTVPEEVRDRVIQYNSNRLVDVVERMRRERLDPFLFERLHVTDWVYKKLQFGLDHFDQYRPLEDTLNQEGAFLIVLTAPDEIIRERMAQNVRAERQANSKIPIPLHLTDPEKAIAKKALYDEFFARSGIRRKVLVPSTNGEDYTELLRGLLRP